MYLSVCLGGRGMRACHSVGVDIKGQLSGGVSLAPPCGSQGLNSGHRAWQKVPLPAEPALLPYLFFKFIYLCVCVGHRYTGACGRQKRVSDPLELELFFFYLLTLIDWRMGYRELSRNLSVAHKSNVLWVPLLHHGTGPTTLGNLSPWLMTLDTAGYRPQGGAVGVGVIKQFRCLQKKAMHKIISHSFF